MKWTWALFLLAVVEPSADVSRQPNGPTTLPTPRKRIEVGKDTRPLTQESFDECSATIVTPSGLMWLARHQSEDGSWSVTGYAHGCEGEAKCLPNPGTDELNVGVTSLAVLAFLGAGHTDLSKDEYRGVCFGGVVKRAIEYLMKVQDTHGGFGGATNARYVFNSALATLAISELYGMTGRQFLRAPAQKGVDFISSARSGHSGWGYRVRDARVDSIVTGWALMAVKSAELSELAFGREAYEEVPAFLDELTDRDTGRVGYRVRGKDGAVIAGRNERFARLSTSTAIAVVSKMFTRKLKDEAMDRQTQLLLTQLPSDAKGARDFHFWYWAELAMSLYDGPNGNKWKTWSEALKKPLLGLQVNDPKRCAHGSWEPDDKWSCEAGRVYATAINILTLQLTYRRW